MFIHPWRCANIYPDCHLARTESIGVRPGYSRSDWSERLCYRNHAQLRWSQVPRLSSTDRPNNAHDQVQKDARAPERPWLCPTMVQSYRTSRKIPEKPNRVPRSRRFPSPHSGSGSAYIDPIGRVCGAPLLWQIPGQSCPDWALYLSQKTRTPPQHQVDQMSLHIYRYQARRAVDFKQV